MLTEAGFRQVAKSVSKLPREIDKIYSSPLIRTLQTAKEIMKVSGAEVIIDNRIREIDWGEYDGKPNNPELDAVRARQAAGDFFVRFGQYGDNKYNLELRLCEFLDDVRKHNFKNKYHRNCIPWNCHFVYEKDIGFAEISFEKGRIWGV